MEPSTLFLRWSATAPSRPRSGRPCPAASEHLLLHYLGWDLQSRANLFGTALRLFPWREMAAFVDWRRLNVRQSQGRAVHGNALIDHRQHTTRVGAAALSTSTVGKFCTPRTTLWASFITWPAQRGSRVAFARLYRW